eukprot:IDg11146t1
MASALSPDVGDTIEVYWPDDETYYAGRVTAFKSVSQRHRVEYFDGDVESLDLKEELWRLVAKAAPRAATPQHLGSILSGAARVVLQPKKTIAKKPSAPKSPVSVVPVSPSRARIRCPRCELPRRARVLIAHIATHWLRDESRRPLAPVKAGGQLVWVQMCAGLCVRYVHDWLFFTSDSTTPVELHFQGDAEVGWMLDVCMGDSVELAMRNYSAWKRPLSIAEWSIEVGIMRTVAMRFARAAFDFESVPTRSSLVAAQLQAAAALQG